MMDMDHSGTKALLAISIVLGLVLTSGAVGAAVGSAEASAGTAQGACVEVYAPPEPGAWVSHNDCIAYAKDLIPIDV